ncbi:hypothetical protein NDN08_005037 [Rhodosorus marinus]|uniref:BRCT domain-containing protein n=1 Tax=Rhodosorus marinus TaxID=101924 RepID=A0AAV8V0Q2_9RHOD|nr:hypothetical protein NDN08_005037 [Rhodosorus marinus]
MSEEVEGTPSPKETGSGISADDVVPSSLPIPSARLTLSTNVADIVQVEISTAAVAEMGSQRGSNSKQVKVADRVSRKLVDTVVEDTDTGLTDDCRGEGPNPVLAETEGTAPDFAATGMTASEANYESQIQPPQSVNSTIQVQQTIKEEPKQDHKATAAAAKYQVEIKTQTQDEILVMETAKESDTFDAQTASDLVVSQTENGKQVAGTLHATEIHQKETRLVRRKRTRSGRVEQADETLMPSNKVMELRNAQLELSKKGARPPSGLTGWVGARTGRRRTKKVRMEGEESEGRVFNGIRFGMTLNKDSLARKASKGYLHEEVARLGGMILENVGDFVEAIEDGGVAVVLIAESPSRTEKFLHALAARLPILSMAWVAACAEQRSVVSTKSYHISPGTAKTEKAPKSFTTTSSLFPTATPPTDRVFARMCFLVQMKTLAARNRTESILFIAGAHVLSRPSLVCTADDPMYLATDRTPPMHLRKFVNRGQMIPVTWDWIVECLVCNYIVPPHRHTEFQP